MAALRDQVVKDTLDEVEVVYLDRRTARWWNQRRQPDDTAVFCGWYWLRRSEEAGPFKTRSAAIRAAYYLFILQRDQPAVGRAAAAPKPKPGRPKARAQLQAA